MDKKVRKQDPPKEEKEEVIKVNIARKFALAYACVGGILMAVGFMGGAIIGNPVREIEVPGPSPKILTLDPAGIEGVLGNPAQSGPCAQLISGASAGTCGIYLSEDKKTVLIIATGLE